MTKEELFIIAADLQDQLAAAERERDELRGRVWEAIQMAESGFDMSKCPSCEQVVRVFAATKGGDDEKA